ncbi:hemolysin-III related-domain-containing protein [Choanephora cucurbitarum]|nr:hemolysin-III related-domain-containing protein [Choanephora cucurbitarum]
MGIQQRNMARVSDSEDRTTLLPKNKSHKLILSWHEIPSWMQDNVFITDGYRRQTNSYVECLKSLFYLHNESVNIWSHLLAFMLFVGFAVQFVWTKPFVDTLTAFDYTYFFVFILGACACLGLSASFHCFACHSEPVAATWNRCDYAGITCLIVGSFFPVVYYGFHCHHIFQVIYLTTIVILGSITAAITLMKHFRSPAYRWVRACLFMALGLFGLIPTLHGIWVYGLNNSFKTVSLGHMILMACTYIAGAIIYGCRFPERTMPGKFNYFGSSHQIFHVCVVIAVISHYLGVMSAMSFWHDASNEEFCNTMFF